ncbi:MAG: S9 family peptidase [Proteobacteria bacterium]|nr:S9 family peptidase [Pseudomonadota bacterium]NOG60804.1 S9 family peptidase [Pseudomonadota bacterium]
MIEKQKAPFGSWRSSITTDLLLGDSVGLGELSVFDDDVYWIEMRPQEKGRYVVVKQVPDGQKRDVIPAEFNARTRVHEYGGGSYLITEKGLVFTNFSDQALYLIDIDNNCLKLTNNEACRYADMIYDKNNERLICVREDHSNENHEAINTIVSVALSRSKDEQILVEGADFYSNPRISHDGKQLCWISWNHPNMPWDNTCLSLAEVTNEGELKNIVCIAGGDDKNEAVCQPLWSPNNTLYFISDRNNWWNLYRIINNNIECIIEMDAEFSVPQWSFRECNYTFINTDTIQAIYRKNGIAYLATINVNEKTIQPIELPYTDFESIVCSGNKSWFLAASPTEFSSIIEYDIDKHQTKILCKANNLNLDKKSISIGESVSFPVDKKNNVHAFFYHPQNEHFTGLDNEKPPLIVVSHGGPTGESHNGIKMVVQFFTSRGFAVLDVNYGGSSGYGRTYRQRLNGQWGIVDVNDCSKAALHVAEQGWVDKDRLAIRGGSAGGFTTLAALAFTDVFKAGASHYGISDLEVMTKDTHKFESRYLDSLIGAYPEELERYKERSPLFSVDRLSCPVIFFQGLEDKIVLPNQAEMMVNALKEKGIPVAYIAYEGEQHGFRQAKNIKRTLEAELYFYSTIFNFECADKIEAVKFL